MRGSMAGLFYTIQELQAQGRMSNAGASSSAQLQLQQRREPLVGAVGSDDGEVELLWGCTAH